MLLLHSIIYESTITLKWTAVSRAPFPSIFSFTRSKTEYFIRRKVSALFVCKTLLCLGEQNFRENLSYNECKWSKAMPPSCLLQNVICAVWFGVAWRGDKQTHTQAKTVPCKCNRVPKILLTFICLIRQWLCTFLPLVLFYTPFNCKLLLQRVSSLLL